MQREAKEKEEQTKAKADEEQSRPASEPSSQANKTPRQERDQTSTPKQASASKDRLKTPASSASRPRHQKTRSEAAREATFASLQRALNQAVAAREHYSPQAENGVLVGNSDISLNLPTSDLAPSGNGPPNSLNSAFSEWASSRDSSMTWTPSQSPENALEYGGLNAVQFSSSNDRLTVPPMESQTDQDMTGTDAFGHVQLSHQSPAWDGHFHGQADAIPEDQPVSESMYGSLRFSTLQLPEGHVARRASSSEELAESMGNIGITSARPPHQTVQQLPNRMDGPVWRRPEKELDIAARRKRPRPAAIGTSNSTRSLVGPSSMSPTTRIPSFGGPHPLRHAKSSHALGSRYAGVRKLSAPQRSPLGISGFPEASCSGSANTDVKRRLQTSVSASNLAPPTPLTPEDLQHLLPSTPREHQYNLSIRRPADGQLFPTTQPMQINVASPPATPMSVDLLSQLQYQTLAPPMSAPAQYSSFPQYSPCSSAPLTGVSWSDMHPVPSHDTSLFQSNYQMSRTPNYVYEQDIDPDSQAASQWPLTDTSTLYGTIKDSATVVINEDQKVTQFHIHEFPEQQEAHRSVAQQLPPQRPKNYTFSHQTPSDF
jgi:hypothetical protein